MRHSLKIAATVTAMAALALSANAQRTIQSLATPDSADPLSIGSIELQQAPGTQDLQAPADPQRETTDRMIVCNFIYDSSTLIPYRVVYMSASQSMTSVLTTTSTLTTMRFALPEDTYLVYTEFYSLDSNGRADLYQPKTIVMHDNVVMDSNKAVEFDASTATHEINFTGLTPDGQELIPPMMIVTDGNVSWSYNSMTVYNVMASTSLMHPVYGEVYTLAGNYGHCREDGRTGATSYNLRVNALPDDMVVASTLLAFTADYRTLTIGLTCQGLPEGDLTNDPADYYTYTESCVHSPLVASLHRDYKSDVIINSFVKGLYMNDFAVETSIPDVTVWNCCPAPAAEFAPIDFSVKPFFYERDETVDSQRQLLKVSGCPMRFSAGDNVDYENPFNTYFDAPAYAVLGTNGERMPLTSMAVTNKKIGDYRQYTFTPTFAGRRGETRQADILNLDVEICHDGTPVCTSMDDLSAWAIAFAKDGHTKGTLTAHFNNAIGEVDGLPSQCTTDITINETDTDVCPPILQFLTFSYADAVYTDAFESLDDATLLFTACDASGTGTSVMDVTSVTVEAAPHGTADFVTLPFSVLKYMESRTALTVYGAPLAQLAELNVKGWYDVRISLSDIAGNSTVTTLAPAFCLKSSTGCPATIAPSGAAATLSCRDGLISIDGAESALIEVFSIDGRRVATSATTSLAAPTAPGVYIVKGSTRGGVVTAKISIK